jgi:hypothetical protein
MLRFFSIGCWGTFYDCAFYKGLLDYIFTVYRVFSSSSSMSLAGRFIVYSVFFASSLASKTVPGVREALDSDLTIGLNSSYGNYIRAPEHLMRSMVALAASSPKSLSSMLPSRD